MNSKFLTITLVCITLALACIQKQSKKKITLYSDSQKKEKLLEGNLCDSNECEIWQFYSNGILSDSGYYDSGVKKGLWKNICNERDTYMSWDVYKNEKIEINYPAGWQVLSRKNRLFVCIQDTNNLKTSDFIILTEYSNDTITLDAIGNNNKDFLINDTSVIKWDFDQWNINGKKAYDIFFSKNEGTKTSYRANLIIEKDSSIYNILFVTFKADDCYISNIYRSLITGIKVKGRKLIYSYEPTY